MHDGKRKRSRDLTCGDYGGVWVHYRLHGDWRERPTTTDLNCWVAGSSEYLQKRSKTWMHFLLVCVYCALIAIHFIVNVICSCNTCTNWWRQNDKDWADNNLISQKGTCLLLSFVQTAMHFQCAICRCPIKQSRARGDIVNCPPFIVNRRYRLSLGTWQAYQFV